MDSPLHSRRLLADAARRFLANATAGNELEPDDAPPRLTLQALEKIRMSRSRDRILANLEEMYREAFQRAQTSGDLSQQTTLDFAFRREQLYFEILLDIRDAIERR